MGLREWPHDSIITPAELQQIAVLSFFSHLVVALLLQVLVNMLSEFAGTGGPFWRYRES